MKNAWRLPNPDWARRVEQDRTQIECSAHKNNPPGAMADAIRAREAATIKLPADGKYLGDWKKGQALAQNGAGSRFTDRAGQANGGNCYACHQLDKRELSYGTVGPSLHQYGKHREYKPIEAKKLYEKIYNPQAVFACSLMPRFGHNQFLTEEQMKDIVAYLMDPNSPVNR
jgi:sulfur-oxidizing protein SoxX